jgi:hypothetical protein
VKSDQERAAYWTPWKGRLIGIASRVGVRARFRRRHLVWVRGMCLVVLLYGPDLHLHPHRMLEKTRRVSDQKAFIISYQTPVVPRTADLSDVPGALVTSNLCCDTCHTTLRRTNSCVRRLAPEETISPISSRRVGAAEMRSVRPLMQSRSARAL